MSPSDSESLLHAEMPARSERRPDDGVGRPSGVTSPGARGLDFIISHVTHYRYSEAVRLAPHILRLTPRRAGIECLEHQITIDPEPESLRDATDADGNTLTHVTFGSPTAHLRIESRFSLRTTASSAVVAPGLPALPWAPGANDSLLDYRTRAAIAPDVAAFARGIASEAGWRAPAFLDRLNRALYARTSRKVRPQGAARAAVDTLARREGACRDLTVLFIDACRSLGIAARFVSGYQARTERADGRRHLHAWPEAFLPGAGWHGFDPTHGARVTDAHVALCAAPDQAGTMPLEGGFYGAGVTADLDYDIRISAR